MDSNTQNKKERPVPLVVHHDEFTESYYLHVINLYRSRVDDEATHRSICEKANDIMRRQAVFKEDLEYCYETCMIDVFGDPAPF